MMLHKFRRAMVNLAREPLRGEVEVDDTWIGDAQAGLRGSRQLKGRKAALVLVAVEKRGQATGSARMVVIPDFKSLTLLAFLKQSVSPGSTIYTDGRKASPDYRKLDSSTCLVSNLCAPTCAKVRSPSSLWPTAQLATCSNG